jgi:ATP-dependent Clp protease ATP-binding subunit ClpC
VDPDALAAQPAEVLPRETSEPSSEPGLTPAAERSLATAFARSQAAGVSCIGPEHILGALPGGADTGAARLLRADGQDAQKPAGLTERTARPDSRPAEPDKPATTLDEFGRDLTEEAKAGRLDPVVGRTEQIEQTIEILSRRSKGNPVLIGEPGVGETAAGARDGSVHRTVRNGARGESGEAVPGNGRAAGADDTANEYGTYDEGRDGGLLTAKAYPGA